MARAAVYRHPEPIHGINVTPFIDVLLVLLIMLIMTIPAMTHKVAIDLPVPRPGPLDPATPHRLVIDRTGSYALDGRTLGGRELLASLEAIQAGADGDATLQLVTDPETPYGAFNHALAIVKRANIRKLGFVGNQAMKF